MTKALTIHQWIPAAHRGDAVGDNARVLRDMFRAWGHESDIFALTIDDDMHGEARRWQDPASRDGDVTIYHYAVPSPMTEAFGRLPGARVLHYHNVTPAHFFAPYDAGLVRMCQLGREQLATLADRTDLALGVSEFNRSELEALGFPSTGVLPIASSAWSRSCVPGVNAAARMRGGPRMSCLVSRIRARHVTAAWPDWRIPC